MANIQGWGEGGWGDSGWGGIPTSSLPMSYYLRLITSEYQGSPKYLSFVQALLQPLDDASSCLDSYTEAFDLDFAAGSQLDTIGAIIGQSRTLSFTPTGTTNAAPTPVTGVILQTNFNEGAAGADLSGKAPATLAGPAVGSTWEYGQPGITWAYRAGGGAIASGDTPAPYGGIFIDVGMSDFTLDVSIDTSSGAQGLVMFRYIDDGHFWFINCDQSNVVQVIEQVGGGQNVLGPYTITNASMHLALTGTTLVLTDDNGGSATVTLSSDATLTATKVGMSMYAGGGMIINNMTVTGTYTPDAASGGGSQVAISPVLDDDTYRLLLRACIARNQWNGTIDSLQGIWQQLFPGGRISVNDGQNMTATIILSGAFTSITKQLIENGLIVPRPEGVLYGYTFSALPIFGFDRNDEYVAGFDVGKWS